ncbi:MAG TPA: glycerate kinase [Candidatus Dormibacteraeota bacterium]|nr:glycerate kinase [Candidatus Dormibacteraeota bacterium]
MKVIVAPNTFKGSLSATQAAKAIARGVREVLPDAEVVEIPVADGGEGTVEALVSANHGTYEWVNVEGPLGDPVLASYGLIHGGKTAVVELASASGFVLVSPAMRDPRKTSTHGFGQLLEAARKAGATSVVAGIGSSATNDGGAGMAQALGYRFLDAAGRELPHGGAALLRLERIDDTKVSPDWRSIKVLVACDVTNPLTGPEGASAVYGPQKGADPVAVRLLDRALGHLADVIERQYGKQVRDVPGAGAAGGTGAGMMAFLDAKLVSGAGLVIDTSGFDEALPGAQLVITGEGRADGQTAYGKAPGEVARRAQEAGIPTALIAGTKGPGWETLLTKGFSSVTTLAQEGDNLQDLMHDARPALTREAALAVKELLRPKSDRRR